VDWVLVTYNNNNNNNNNSNLQQQQQQQQQQPFVQCVVVSIGIDMSVRFSNGIITS